MTQTARKHPDQAHYGPGQRLLRLIPHALAGVLAAALFLGVADLVSRLFGPTSSTLVALGQAVIRLSPSWLQEFAISASATATNWCSTSAWVWSAPSSPH